MKPMPKLSAEEKAKLLDVARVSRGMSSLEQSNFWSEFEQELGRQLERRPLVKHKTK